MQTRQRLNKLQQYQLQQCQTGRPYETNIILPWVANEANTARVSTTIRYTKRSMLINPALLELSQGPEMIYLAQSVGQAYWTENH